MPRASANGATARTTLASRRLASLRRLVRMEFWAGALVVPFLSAFTTCLLWPDPCAFCRSVGMKNRTSANVVPNLATFIATTEPVRLTAIHPPLGGLWIDFGAGAEVVTSLLAVTADAVTPPRRAAASGFTFGQVRRLCPLAPHPPHMRLPPTFLLPFPMDFYF